MSLDLILVGLACFALGFGGGHMVGWGDGHIDGYEFGVRHGYYAGVNGHKPEVIERENSTDRET